MGTNHKPACSAQYGAEGVWHRGVLRAVLFCPICHMNMCKIPLNNTKLAKQLDSLKNSIDFLTEERAFDWLEENKETQTDIVLETKQK